jgi:hypothetical protein
MQHVVMAAGGEVAFRGGDRYDILVSNLSSFRYKTNAMDQSLP